jgi:glycosyltransferase involved in cell wall biosynthesis
MKKKVLIAIGSACIGGSEKQILKLSEQLRNNEVDCHIAFLIKGGPLEKLARELEIPYNICNLSKYNMIKTGIGIFRLLIKFKSENYDTYYIFLPHAVLLLGPLLRIFFRNKHIVYGVRGSIFRKNNLFYRLYRLELRNGKSIICNSNSLMSEIKSISRIQSSRVELIHNGIELPLAQPQEREKFNAGKNVVVISNFHSYKGYDLLLAAISKVNEVSLNITLVGGGPDFESIKARSEEIENHHFKFTGQIDNISEILAIQDFAIHPSRTEGLSNAILEELAFGLPVIAFNVGGNSDLILNGFNGFLHEIHEISNFATSITILASSLDRQKELSLNASESVKRFSWEGNVTKHIECLFPLHLD